MTVYYKIRHKETGLFVKGTPHYLSYDGTGRIFQKMGRLRAFLTGVMNCQYGRYSRHVDLGEWEIVELEMVVKDTKEVIDVVDSKKIVEILAR
jgi:hypothetical protein